MDRTARCSSRSTSCARRQTTAFSWGNKYAKDLAAIVAVLVASCVTALPVAADLDQTSKDYLEGIWLIGKQPDKGMCIAHEYGEEQWEFEFRKTGGRLLIFEPYDLFTAVSVPQIERTGDLLSIQGQTRDGKLIPLNPIRLLPPDRIELLPKAEDGSSAATSPKAVIAYRCGAADFAVNSSVTMEALAVLTPSLSGSQGFPEVEPGVSDEDLCQGRGKGRWLQFELLGPVHYWVFGRGPWPEHRLEFDFVRSVRQLDPHALKLGMQERLAKGEGWDAAESRGKNYELTVIDHGARIEIPELSATFARCKPDDPGGVGMHRW
jgi:hypothetical protein